VEVLKLLGDFKVHGSVNLGLNENETHKLYGLLNKNGDEKDLLTKGQYIFDTTVIDRLVVHPIDSCIVYENGATYAIKGRLVPKPKVTTGGGDNFNAGYCLGLLYGFPTEHCMILAMATSGSYVTHGRSPEIKEVIHYLDNWLAAL
jgi:sugar/nucleoside kinase (ribokinase family)